MNEITVATVQMTSILGDVRGNAASMRSWIEQAAGQGAHLVIFPEASLTGYTVGKAVEAAIAVDGEEPFELESFAERQGVAIGYGLIEAGEGEKRPYLTYVVASSEGRMAYRKTHLGTREEKAFAAGDDLSVTQAAGVRVGVELCWEGHIPDIATVLRAKGAELIIVPHASGSSGFHRVELWDRFLPARAYDNGLFVVACNAIMRNRKDERIGGGAAAYDPKGARISYADSLDDNIMLVTLGGTLPRESPDVGMHNISFFDRRRPELYAYATMAP